MDGRQTENPENLDETFELLREPEGTAWIGLYLPDEFGPHDGASGGVRMRSVIVSRSFRAVITCWERLQPP